MSKEEQIKKDLAQAKKGCEKDEEPCVVIRASQPQSYSIGKIKK